MTQPNQPPAGAPYPPRPPKYRPRARWFFIGGGLVLVAVVLFVGALFTALQPLFSEDAHFAAASPQQLELPAHEERALYTDGPALSCSLTDGSGADLPLRGVSGDFTFNEWTAVSRFDTGDGRVTVDCSAGDSSGQVRVGELPSTGRFVGALVVGIFGPFLLGGAGVVILIVTTVLTLSRQPRPAGPGHP